MSQVTPTDEGSSSLLLDALEPSLRGTLEARAVTRNLHAGECLFLAGEPPRHVYVVTAGVLKLVARDPWGSETILGLVLPGETAGEIAAVDGLDQPLEALAATACRAISFVAEDFIRALELSPRAALVLAGSLATRHRWICETARERTSSGVQARLAGRLLDLADILGRLGDRGIEIDLPLAQEDLGRLAGMCRESANKALSSFRARGIIDYRDRKVRILRPDVLERVRLGVST